MILLRPTPSQHPYMSVDDSAIIHAVPPVGSQHPNYQSGKNYVLGETAYSPVTHFEYESLQNNNQGNNPDDRANHSDKWLRLGAGNIHRLFDRRTGQLCSHSGEISVTLRPGAIVDAIALFGMEASQLSITVTDPIEGEVYSMAQNLVAPLSQSGMWHWLFEPVRRTKKILITGLPAYGTAEVTIRLTAPNNSTVKCGEIVPGRATVIGDGEWDFTIGGDDYSVMEFDSFGVGEYAPGGYNDYLDIDARLPTHSAEAIKELFASVRGQPIVLAGEDTGRYGTLVYGLCQQPRIKLRNSKFSKMNIEMRGLS